MKASSYMSNELYLQQLRRQYIQIGEDYIMAIRKGRSKSEIKDIILSIRSLLTEIKAIEEDVKRNPQNIAA
jgi:hypothetical protein